MEQIKSMCTGVTGVLMCLLGCACSVAPIVLCVYLGIYAFNNPDNDAWLGVKDDGAYELFKDEAAGKTAEAKELVDIHTRFVNWFLTGFILALAPIGISILTGISSMINPTCGSALGGILGCGWTCSQLAWWITGIVWRFRADGSYSVGDIKPPTKNEEEWTKLVTGDDSLYQHQSGKFLAIYYIICWSIILFSCVSSLIIAIVGFCKAKQD